jgi:hypothetical protein
LQKTLDNVSSEHNGTAAEIVLFEDLRKKFAQDDLEEKIVGVEMPDIVQMIVTENGNRFATRILWDMKTGDVITSTDIMKAKRYQEKFKSEYYSCFARSVIMIMIQ